MCDENEIGYKLIIDDLHKGIIYKNELFRNIEIGDTFDGYIKQVREDNKIDITINDVAVNRIDALAERFYQFIKINGGSTSLCDNSSPEEIKSILQCSKKDFKKAIGALYKSHRINIDENKITIIDEK